MPTPEQLSDLAQLRTVAEHFATEVTMIGATALQCFMDLPRFTNDIDLVVALDLEHFAEFREALRGKSWRQEPRWDHRWLAPRGSLIDIVPAGPGLRAARQVIWPESEFAMSLVGFEHVFLRAVELDLGAAVLFSVAPPPVVALLKIVAYMEDPQRRRKDMDDLRVLFNRYEVKSDRIFSDPVFAANLEDIDYASAFLLGTDIGIFATNDDAAIVRSFLDHMQIPAEELSELDSDDFRQQNIQRFQQQLRAFSDGFNRSVTR